MQEIIDELKDIISDEVQNDRMDSMLYHAMLTRLDYLETKFLELNKHFVVGRSEQLSCSTCKWLKRTDNYCDTCFKFEKHEPAT